MHLKALHKGFLAATGSVMGFSLGVSWWLSTLPAASPSLLRNLALIGASFVLAYVVETTWLGSRVEFEGDREEWLGFLVGVGFAALLGVALSLLAAEHRAAGHDNILDAFALAWSSSSLLLLGALLVLKPLLADRHRVDITPPRDPH